MIFDGVEYKPKGDRFYCPFSCHDPDWPAPHWKTEKGFAKHLSQCTGKAQADWKPNPPPERKKFADCPDCGAVILEMASCWDMGDRLVCIDCYRPYFEAGIGFHAPAGLVLPGMSLEG